MKKTCLLSQSDAEFNQLALMKCHAVSLSLDGTAMSPLHQEWQKIPPGKNDNNLNIR